MRTCPVVGLGLLLGLAVVWAGDDAGAPPTTQPALADIPAQRLFDRLVVMQDPSFVYTRDVLLARGQALIPMLEIEQRSGDWRRQLAAEALLLRLRKRKLVAQWEEAVGGYCRYAATTCEYEAVLDTPGRVTLKPSGSGAAVTFDRQGVPLLVEHVWLNFYYGSGDEYQYRVQRLVRLLGHLGDARAAWPVLLATGREYGLRQSGEDALAAIGPPAVASLIDALRADAAAEKPGVWAPRLWMVCSVLGRIGDRAAVEPLMKLLGETPQSRTAAVAAEALAAMGVKEAAEPIAARLVQLLAVRRPDREREAFQGFCRAFRRLSPASAAALGKQRERMENPRWRMLLSGLEMQVTDAKRLAAYEARFPTDRMHWTARPAEVPIPDDDLRSVGLGRLMVRAAWHGMGIHSAALGRRKAPGALEFLLGSLDLPGAIEGLALLGDARAVASLAQLLSEPDARGPEAARAIYRIGGDQALAALRRAAEQREQARPAAAQALQELARAFVLALEKKNDQLAALLVDDRPDVRHAAAEGLVRLGDARGAPILLQQAAKSEAGEHLRLRELLLSLGKQALPAIKQARAPENPLALRVAADAVAFQIDRPELCRAFDRRLEEAWQSIRQMHVIRPEMILGAGRAAAHGQPAELAPYAEACVLFRLGVGDVAAGALPELAQERSIPVLVQAVRRGLRSGLAALALKAFGEKGLQAARNLPAPDPDKAAYAERSARSRAGARALALAGDPAGVDQIVEALTSRWRVAGEPDDSPQARQRRDAWVGRVEAMIRAARHFHDPRLFEAMLKLYQSPDGERMRSRLLGAMVRYDDKRLVPILKTVVLTAGDRSADQHTAVRALAGRDDFDLMNFLLDGLDPQQPEATRVAAVVALHLVVRQYLPQKHEQWRGTAARRWEALLNDPSRLVQHRAAYALAERQVQAAAPRMAEWLSPEHPHEDPKVYEFLGRFGDKSLGPKLLSIFQKHRWWFAAAALGDLGYVEAASELALELRRPTPHQYCAPVANALVRLGPEGLKQAGVALRDTRDPGAFAALMRAFERQGAKAADQWEIIANKVTVLGRDYEAAVHMGDLEPNQRPSARRSLEEQALKAMAAVDPARSEPILQRLAVEHEDPQIRTVAIDLLRRPAP